MPYMTDDLVYLSCPKCGRGIPEAFTRGSPPMMYTHRRGRGHANCRLVVSVALRGDDHRIEVVPRDVRMEDVVLMRLREWKAAA